MKPHHLKLHLLLTISVLVILNCPSRGLLAQSVSRPNVVVILADDMGYGDVSALNPDARTRTPNIDALVAHGLTFTDAHASASVCTPSRYGLLTGRYAWRREGTGVVNGFQGSVMDTGRLTLGDLFQKAGYRTACIGKWHLGLGWQTKDGQPAVQDRSTGRSNVDYSLPVTTGPSDFGFEYSFIHPASLDMAPYLFLENHAAVDSNMILTDEVYQAERENTVYSWDKKHTQPGDVYWSKGVWWRRGEIAESFRVINCLPEIANQSQRYVRNQVFLQNTASDDNRAPFFLYLPLTGPHTPWIVTQEFQGQTPIGDYGDFVLQVDDVMGQIIRALQETGAWENTIVIFSSDNGAYWPQEEIELKQHDAHAGSRGQKGDVWEGGHHVPLIVTWPAMLEDARRYDGLTSLTDIYATFSDLLDQEIQPGTAEDSESFSPLLTGQSILSHRASMVHQSSRGLFGYREGDWKYIDGLGSGGFTPPATVEPGADGATGQLYNLANDPRESKNQFAQEPNRVKAMKRALAKEVE